MILGVLIALQMKNVTDDNLSQANLAELQDKLIEYAKKNAELSARNSELSDYIDIIENDMAAGDEQINAIVKEKERAAVFAGLREATNYGIQITVGCAADIPIKDSVLRQFVNELRALGAQAIAINDERMVAMSEIRASGSSIVINGNPLNRYGKFVIKAITNPAKEDNIMEYLEIIRQNIISDPVFMNDNYDIQFSAVPKLTIPALSEDSVAFKIDLLTSASD